MKWLESRTVLRDLEEWMELKHLDILHIYSALDKDCEMEVKCLGSSSMKPLRAEWDVLTVLCAGVRIGGCR